MRSSRRSGRWCWPRASAAFVPDQFADVPHWTNREAVLGCDFARLLAIVGGGAIGVELGQAMARLGARSVWSRWRIGS